MDEHRPVFIIGPPRSGSTFFAALLNAHPDIFITGETRAMVYVSRMIGSMLQDPWCIAGAREQFVPIARRHARQMVLDFYRELNAMDARRWGDKFPHYADPDVAPSCLEAMDDLFPAAQFICLVRDPRAVVASVMAKHLTAGSPRGTGLDEGIQVWNRCCATAMAFGAAIGTERYLCVRYEDVMQTPETAIAAILGFLGEAPSEALPAFVAAQRAVPAPLSAPTSEMHAATFPLRTWEGRLSRSEECKILDRTATVRPAVGYST